MTPGLPEVAQAFDTVAEAYERARPGYPASALAHVVAALGLGGAGTAVDVAAGTGKLTRELVPHARLVVAVEPLPAMRAVLHREVPAAHVVAGVAESLPLRSGSADALTVAAALHWFDRARAFPEIHRVLAADATVAVLRNRRDEDSPLQRDLSELAAPLRSAARRSRTHDVAAEFGASGLFHPPQRTTYVNSQRLDREALLERVASIGYVAAQPPDVRQRIATRAEELFDRHADGGGTVELRYVTEVVTARRRR